jgi:hypothetical protein
MPDDDVLATLGDHGNTGPRPESVTPPTGRRSTAALVMQLALPALVLVFAMTFLAKIWGLGFQASIWPKALLIALIPALLALIFREVRSWARAPLGSADGEPLPAAVEIKMTGRRPWLRSVYVVVMMALYVYAVPRLGYYTCSALFLVVTMLLLGVRRVLVLVLSAVGWLAFSYLVLGRLLQLILPTGTFH